MSNPADNATRTQRFNDAVSAFTPPSPTRHAKLMPLKEGIVELRQKGASLRLIRELLATVDVLVGTDTIARFLAEVNGDSPPQRSSKRSTRRRAAVAASNGRRPADAPVITAASSPARTPIQSQSNDAPAERTRTRGPRVADPRTL
jgi:hypothetical protein